MMPVVSRPMRFIRTSRRALLVAPVVACVIAAPSATAAMRPALVLSGHAANNTVVVRATGTDAGIYSVDGGPSRRFSGIRSLTIRGHGGHDVCRIVNPPHALFAPPGGIRCEGGNQPGQPRRGVLDVSGGRAATSAYRPGAVPGSGTLVHSLGRTRQVIRFTGLAPVTTTASAANYIFTDPIANDVVGVISGSTSGTWTIESLEDPSAWESETFANQEAVTINATHPGDSITLEPASQETGLTQLNMNASGSIAVVGADVGASTPVALSAGDTITGAGPSPELVGGALAAVAPNGIGPLTATVPGFAATSTSGSIELHDTGSLAAGSASGQLAQTGVSAGQNVTLSSTGTLSNDGAISGADAELSASALDLTNGSVSAPAVTLAPVSDGGTVALGGAGGSGTLGVSQASLNRIQTPALTIGGPTTGAITIAAPISVTAAGLTLEGTGGFSASGGGGVTAAGSLTFSDDGAGGRPWTIGPTSVADGVGSPVSYTARSLAVNGGSGSDTFDVTPSTTTPMRVDGGGPAGGTSGDSLTFEAGGAVVTGAAQAPQGDLIAAGHADVRYASIEQVHVANPGSTGSPTATPAPACSLLARTSAVRTGRARKPPPAPFGLLAACSQTARASITGTLSVTSRATRRGRRKSKTTRIAVKVGPVKLRAGKITAIAVKIPGPALVALRSGAHESLSLTLTAKAGAHMTRVRVTVKRLSRARSS